jgi:hypothetical protein
VVSAGLVASRGPLLVGIDPLVVAGIRAAASPGEQIRVDLEALSVAETMANGAAPLRVWLANAQHLAGPRVEAETFRRFLGRTEERGGAARPSKVRGAVVLDHVEILEAHQAAMEANLAAAREALLAGLDHRLVAGIPIESNPRDQLLADLDALNAAGVLADGTVPLRDWLRNAALLAGPRVQAPTFSRLAERIPESGTGRGETGGTAPRSETPDRNQLLDALLALSAGQLELFIYKLGIPMAILPGASAARATRCVVILQWAEQQGRLADVSKLLAEVTGGGKSGS